MNKRLTDNQIRELIRKAGERFRLSITDKGILKANLMDVIKSSSSRIKEGSSMTYQSRRKFTMPLIPIIIAALIAFGGGTAVLADSAKPGDFLYPVDQWVERFQERVTWTQEAKAGLLARFSEERMAELQGLLAMDPEQMKEKIQARWEQHKEQAMQRLAESIERANTVRERFEEKLQNAGEEQQVQYQKVIDTMDEIVARREQKMEQVESREFPGVGQLPLRQIIRQRIENNEVQMQEIREQVRAEFGDEMPGVGAGEGAQNHKGQSSINPAIAHNPYAPKLEDFLTPPQELTDAQKELQEKLVELGKQLAAKLKDAFSKPIDPKDNPKLPPQPQLMSLV